MKLAIAAKWSEKRFSRIDATQHRKNRVMCFAIPLCVLFAVSLIVSCDSNTKEQTWLLGDSGGNVLTPYDFIATDEEVAMRSAAEKSSSDLTEPRTIHAPNTTQDPQIQVVSPASMPAYPITVGGMVGQVSGRPIYVDDFFEPISDILAAWGQQKEYRVFLRDSKDLIHQRLRKVIENELLIAEALGSLTEEEQTGLAAMITRARGEVVLEGGGNERAAEEKLRREIGDADISIEEYMSQMRDQQLVFEKVVRKIQGRVRVTRQDVERYYRDHHDEFNPAPSIQIRIAGAKSDDSLRIQQITDGLQAGTPFEIIAAQHTSLLASRDGLMSEIPLPDGLSGTKITAWENVNDQLRTLSQGDYAGPIEVPSYALWVYVEKYSDGSGKSLYEVQERIHNTIMQARYKEESTNYLEALVARGNYDDMNRMADSLWAVAIDRWAPESSND